MDHVYAITLMAFDTKVIQMEKKSALLNFNWHKGLAIFLQRRWVMDPFVNLLDIYCFNTIKCIIFFPIELKM